MREFIKEYKSIEEIMTENKLFIREKLGDDFDIAHELVDKLRCQFDIVSWTIKEEISTSKVIRPILLSGFYKSLIGIIGCIELDSKGLYGSSRIIMRQVFEYLLVAKFCSLNNNIDLYNNWENDRGISIAKNIFKKIVSPNPQEFEEFWGLLCKFTHATTYSQQANLNADLNINEINMNCIFTRILIEMNNHVFNTHLVNNSMLFYHNYYGYKDEIELYKDNKIALKQLLTISKQNMGKDAKKLIYKFKLKWKTC